MGRYNDFLGKLPAPLPELCGYQGFSPLLFALDEDGMLAPVSDSTESLEKILRVEFWVESANDYVFVHRTNPGDQWSLPRMDGSGRLVYNLADIRSNISEIDSEEDLHPAIRKGNLSANTNSFNEDLPKVSSNKKFNQAMHKRSGSVEDDDPIVSLIYILMRDHVSPGEMEKVVRDWEEHCERGIYASSYCNGWLASYAQDLSSRLKHPYREDHEGS
jgi:hypothetical protein